MHQPAEMHGQVVACFKNKLPLWQPPPGFPQNPAIRSVLAASQSKSTFGGEFTELTAIENNQFIVSCFCIGWPYARQNGVKNHGSVKQGSSIDPTKNNQGNEKECQIDDCGQSGAECINCHQANAECLVAHFKNCIHERNRSQPCQKFKEEFDTVDDKDVDDHRKCKKCLESDFRDPHLQHDNGFIAGGIHVGSDLDDNQDDDDRIGFQTIDGLCKRFADFGESGNAADQCQYQKGDENGFTSQCTAGAQHRAVAGPFGAPKRDGR